VPPGGAPARLVLGDGSVWMMAPNDPAFAGVRAMVELQRSRNARSSHPAIAELAGSSEWRCRG